MKITRKTLNNWEIKEPIMPAKQLKPINPNSTIQKCDPFGFIFGLPKLTNEEPKLARIKIIQKQKISILNVQSNHPNQKQLGKYYSSKLRNTLMNRTKELFRPIKRHYSLAEANKIVEESQAAKEKEKRHKKVPIALDHSSHKTLQILQKVIFKDIDFYLKEKSTIELYSNKLPSLQGRILNKKQSLSPQKTRLSNFLKNEALPTKYLPKSQAKYQIPYLSGWQVPQTSQF